MAMNNLERILQKDNKQLSKIARKEIARYCFTSNRVWIQTTLRGSQRHLHQMRHGRSWSSTKQILRTLTQRYDHIVVAIEKSKDLNKMKVEDLQGSLEAHELRAKERSKNGQREDDEAQMTIENADSDEVLLMATTKSDDDCPEQWYLDIGCSNHMTDHKYWFINIDEKVKREIRFA
uniref:Uncharacterized protein LOC105851773 n=1 Tax=Cicer arietinum TaxID=3827 RepID=A0A1S3E0S4_CICAR|nr:uncharacterized protein LOC105851773 [Cicer arietinum]